jgi:hypothetical protein
VHYPRSREESVSESKGGPFDCLSHYDAAKMETPRLPFDGSGSISNFDAFVFLFALQRAGNAIQSLL